MTKTRRLFCVLWIMAGMAAILVAAESEDDSDASGASSVIFRPRSGQTLVKTIVAKSGTSTAAVEFIERHVQTDVQTVTETPTNGQFIIWIDNDGFPFTNNDIVVYWHEATQVPDFRSVTNATATNVWLSSGISAAGTDEDRVYEMTNAASIPIGTSLYSLAGSVLYATPGDSPLRVVLTGATNGTLIVTVGD